MNFVDYNYYITKGKDNDPFKLLTPLIQSNTRHSLNKLLDIYPNLPTKYKTVSEEEFKEYILVIGHSYLLNYESIQEGTLIKIDNPSFNYKRFNNIVTHIELRVRQLHYIMENNPSFGFFLLQDNPSRADQRCRRCSVWSWTCREGEAVVRVAMLRIASAAVDKA